MKMRVFFFPNYFGFSRMVAFLDFCIFSCSNQFASSPLSLKFLYVNSLPSNLVPPDFDMLN